MGNLLDLFAKSPFEPLVEHARQVHACVALLRPIGDAILAGDMPRLTELQKQMSEREYEADRLKDEIRQELPPRYFLPVDREEVAKFLTQMDRLADDAEDFAVIATFRKIHLPQEFHAEFLALVDKVAQVSETLLDVAERLAQLQRDAFVGRGADLVMEKIAEVARMEWEADGISCQFARHYYGTDGIDPLTIMILDKLCRSLGGVADHAENVGKLLRLMISRR